MSNVVEIRPRQNCENCRFSYDGGKLGYAEAMCRRHPPAVTDNGTKFPEVGWFEWCGEWETQHA